MRKWRRLARLIGETLREIGILALVLAPLDSAFGGANVNIDRLVMAMVIGAILIIVGLRLETRT